MPEQHLKTGRTSELPKLILGADSNYWNIGSSVAAVRLMVMRSIGICVFEIICQFTIRNSADPMNLHPD
jgi:hypothetical protein